MIKTIKILTRKWTMAVVGLAVLMTSCGNIDDDERFIYVKPAPAERCVLLEDYTGQECPNCPKAAPVIDQLHEIYGDKVIAVGIHAGRKSWPSSAETNYMGLATSEGEEYYKSVGSPAQPSGNINRAGSPSTIDQWSSHVEEAISKAAPLSLSITAGYDEATRGITTTINAMGTDGNTSGKLQLWIIEDNIVAPQYLPDGSAQVDYTHNHVFRAAVNGTWGEDFSISEGEEKSLTHTATLQAHCKAENVSIVAFVYNDGGVQQCCVSKLIND